MGCSKPKDQNTSDPSSVCAEEVTERIGVPVWVSLSDTEFEALTLLTEQFMETSPNIVIELENYSEEELDQKLHASFADVKQLPAVVQAMPYWMVPAANDDLLISWDRLCLTQETYDMIDDFPQQLHPSHFSNHYAFPFLLRFNVLWYQTQYINTHQIDKIQSTQDILPLLTEIKTDTPRFLGIDHFSDYYWDQVLNEHSVQLETFDAQSKESQHVIQEYLTGVQEQLISPAYGEELVQQINAEMIPILWASSDYFKRHPELQEEGWQYRPLPLSKVRDQSFYWYVFSLNTPQVQKGVSEWMNYLYSSQDAELWKDILMPNQWEQSFKTTQLYMPKLTETLPIIMETTQQMHHQWRYKKNIDQAQELEKFSETLRSILD